MYNPTGLLRPQIKQESVLGCLFMAKIGIGIIFGIIAEIIVLAAPNSITHVQPKALPDLCAPAASMRMWIRPIQLS